MQHVFSFKLGWRIMGVNHKTLLHRRMHCKGEWNSNYLQRRELSYYARKLPAGKNHNEYWKLERMKLCFRVSRDIPICLFGPSQSHVNSESVDALDPSRSGLCLPRLLTVNKYILNSVYLTLIFL